MAVNLPRLSTAGPVVQGQSGYPSQHLVQWWNQVCTQIEANINQLTTQQAQIDSALGIATGASSGATDAAAQAALATQAIAVLLTPIANGDLIGNSSGSSGLPMDTTLSAILDIAIGSAQGDILFRGAAGWKKLAPGTAGQKLTSGGPAADVSWT